MRVSEGVLQADADHVKVGPGGAAGCVNLGVGPIVLVGGAGVDELQLRLLGQIVEVTGTEHGGPGLPVQLVSYAGAGNCVRAGTVLGNADCSTDITGGQVVLCCDPPGVAFVFRNSVAVVKLVLQGFEARMQRQVAQCPAGADLPSVVFGVGASSSSSGKLGDAKHVLVVFVADIDVERHAFRLPLGADREDLGIDIDSGGLGLERAQSFVDFEGDAVPVRALVPDLLFGTTIEADATFGWL